jgi:hypothetical protein
MLPIRVPRIASILLGFLVFDGCAILVGFCKLSLICKITILVFFILCVLDWVGIRRGRTAKQAMLAATVWEDNSTSTRQARHHPSRPTPHWYRAPNSSSPPSKCVQQYFLLSFRYCRLLPPFFGFFVSLPHVFAIFCLKWFMIQAKWRGGRGVAVDKWGKKVKPAGLDLGFVTRHVTVSSSAFAGSGRGICLVWCALGKLKPLL